MESRPSFCTTATAPGWFAVFDAHSTRFPMPYSTRLPSPCITRRNCPLREVMLSLTCSVLPALMVSLYVVALAGAASPTMPAITTAVATVIAASLVRMVVLVVVVLLRMCPLSTTRRVRAERDPP
ncbi:hypothetical protein [Curtobacterium sp. SL109]|uniref:hypothetical protein n=1 Tax=Curtobacterium sp. SL109 TaxID=2994662 RepID=UPI0022747CFE|nr:hypothetical protein [Curtobacterium sp. SL109]MCY1693870.1 hypothetical protein [Curtobacterium sp. SL109]